MGDTVFVRIVGLDLVKNHISVSMRFTYTKTNEEVTSSCGHRRKNLQEKILIVLNEKGYNPEFFFAGEIVGIRDYGIFVRFDACQLREGVEGELVGLVHISAISVNRVQSIKSKLKVRDEVKVRVMGIDLDRKKISLSMIRSEDEKKSLRRDYNIHKHTFKRGKQVINTDNIHTVNWKEKIDKFQKNQPKFSNMPIIIDRRI